MNALFADFLLNHTALNMGIRINIPHLNTGIRVLAAASLSLSGPLLIPGMSTGGASRIGWMAPASFSRYARNLGNACTEVKYH